MCHFTGYVGDFDDVNNSATMINFIFYFSGGSRLCNTFLGTLIMPICTLSFRVIWATFTTAKMQIWEPIMFRYFLRHEFWLTPPSLFNLEEHCRKGRGSLLLQRLLKQKDGPKSSLGNIGESLVLCFCCKNYLLYVGSCFSHREPDKTSKTWMIANPCMHLSIIIALFNICALLVSLSLV